MFGLLLPLFQSLILPEDTPIAVDKILFVILYFAKIAKKLSLLYKINTSKLCNMTIYSKMRNLY